MGRKRGATGLSGILLVDKPSGMTSHDVISRIRRITGEGRIGHAGTLDPMATGLLVVLVGPAARLAPYLTSAEKSYEATVLFGQETDTDDAEGCVTVSAPIPDEVGDPFFACATVAALVGEHTQVPPAFSAIKCEGRVAHRVARSGGMIELEPRRFRILDAVLTGVRLDPVPAWDLTLTVSKGTYIRAIARDLGRAVDCAAHLGALRRTRSGAMEVADCVALDELETPEDVTRRFLDPVQALSLPVLDVGDGDAERVTTGLSLLHAPADNTPGEIPADNGNVAITHDGALIAIYSQSETALVPKTVFPTGIKGDVQCPQGS
jgi:tRNA pseudouridine55 synthase